MADSNTVDLNCHAAARNMYGCLPCPKCSSHMRWARDTDFMVLCDDCGFQERGVNVTAQCAGDEYEEVRDAE